MFFSVKKNKLINSYLLVLIALIFWTGGSFLMRYLAWPDYRFWYHVSSISLLLFMVFLYLFFLRYLGQTQGSHLIVFGSIILVVIIINSVTGFFLRAPNHISAQNGVCRFEYKMTLGSTFILLLAGVIMMDLIRITYISTKENKVLYHQIEPMLLGMVIMFIGNLALYLPVLKGFPINIVSGVINACLMFYGLMKRRQFRLQYLSHGGVSYFGALGLIAIIFSNISSSMLRTIKSYLPINEEHYLLIIAALMMQFTLGIAYIWRGIVNKVFIRDEQMQRECLQEFSATVSKSLRIKDIYFEIIKIVKKATDIDGVYIFFQSQEDSTYKIIFADSETESMNLELKADHPLVTYLKENAHCIFIQDFFNDSLGKSVSEEEKQNYRKFGIQYGLGIKGDENSLKTILLLSNTKKQTKFNQNDSAFIESVGLIAGIAIQNALLYEKAYKESITDELTGLYNRRYFTEKLEKTFITCKDRSLVLLLLSVDDFKLYNQLYGMVEGDRALQKIAQILKNCVGKDGICARYSGKEFAIILPNYDILPSKELAETISLQINRMNDNQSNYAIKKLTVSIGISGYPNGAQSVKELLQNVDLAVYHVKRHGKNAVRVFDVKSALDGEQQSKEEASPQNVYTEYESMVYALTATIDAKDHYTFHHSNNVAYYATSLAAALGMNEETIEVVRQSALLHDIGKIGIAESILNKPGRLTEEEYEIVKMHVENSIGIIKHIPAFDYVIPAVLAHHEHYDGKGYPRQLKGEEIPVTGRILCIADSFDAIISKRCYKKSATLPQAIKILKEEAGKQFDPVMVKVFYQLLEQGKVKVAANEENLQ